MRTRPFLLTLLLLSILPCGLCLRASAPAAPPSVKDPAVIDPADYRISKRDLQRARDLLSAPSPAEPVVFPNPAPGAQWYPSAGLGLFMHWGIHSTRGAQPSWNMIKGYRYGGTYHSREEYYSWALDWEPDNFCPEKYLRAAKEAGFSYAVLTTRHHDGYALWPSRYGIGVKQYMHGRDLVREYVDACRRTGMRVGFYFSPRDWHYPGDRPLSEFDVQTWGKRGPVEDEAANRKAFERFFAYVLAQLEELLTSYGKIDLLWLDGMGWYGIPVQDLCTEKVYAWIRSLQPDIVINDRWENIVNPDNPSGTGMRIGDFTTPFECTVPTYTPSPWWEHCHIWTDHGGGWGYNVQGEFRPLGWFLRSLVMSRSYGGNFLPNAGPAPSGDMHPNFYKALAEVREWMAANAESVIAAGPTPGAERSNVPLTTRSGPEGKIWYAHLLEGFKGEVSVRTDSAPASLTLLRTGEKIPFIFRNGFISFSLPAEKRGAGDDVVKIVL